MGRPTVHPDLFFWSRFSFAWRELIVHCLDFAEVKRPCLPERVGDLSEQ